MRDQGAAPRLRRPPLQNCRPHLLWLRDQGKHRLEGGPRGGMASVRGDLPGPGSEPDRPGLGRMRRSQGSARPTPPFAGQGSPARGDRCRQRPRRDTGGSRGNDRASVALCSTGTTVSLHELRHGTDGPVGGDQQTRRTQRWGRDRPSPGPRPRGQPKHALTAFRDKLGHRSELGCLYRSIGEAGWFLLWAGPRVRILFPPAASPVQT
jgi:hypothetical protein